MGNECYFKHDINSKLNKYIGLYCGDNIFGLASTWFNR